MKVFIVDDEFLQRELVKKTVDWKKLNMEVTGEAEDGEEAIKKIETLKPDILIMDINIPYIDGIEVSKWAKKKIPEIQIIILTAYGEFEYARQAISFGAVSFVLKPVNPQELMEELKKCRDNLKKMEKQRESIWELKKEVSRQQKEQKLLERLSGICLPREQEIIRGEVSSIDESQEMLRVFMEKGMTLLEKKKIPAASKKVQEAVKFIDENFERFDMGLNLVAEAVGVNASYLSNIFKKEQGCSLSKYITSVRLEEARRLLVKYTDRTLIEISEAVGYTDVYYFSKNFKSYYGISPSKYQEGKR